jgi:murein DD-endopeptidase MepM/ murein hydrolase activator NlpD
LGGATIVLAGVVAAGTMIERGTPAGTPPAVIDWAANAPGHVSSDAPARVAGPTPNQPPSATATRVVPRYVFPVDGKVSYARTHHDYPASDIISPCGSPVVAVTDGVVLEVSRQDSYNAKADDGSLRGGLFVSLLGDDGVRYYGSHLRLVLAGVDANVRVVAGQKLGEVGDTGDAGACHLHFGISPTCARTADWWIRRGVIWPWPYLDAWRSTNPKSPVAEITAWSTQHGCPKSP